MKKITIEEVLAICTFTGGKPETITYQELNFFDKENLLAEKSLILGTFQVPESSRIQSYLRGYASNHPETGNLVFIMSDMIPLMPAQSLGIYYTCFTFILPSDHFMVMGCLKEKKTFIPFGPFTSSAAKRFTIFVPMNGVIVPKPIFVPFASEDMPGIVGITFAFEWY